MADELELTPQELGAKGGKVRAARLTREQRAEIARKGARAKWAKEGVQMNEPVPVAYGSPDRPLRIGNAEIPCYVLQDGRRVLSQRGLQAALGLSTGGGKGGARRLGAFLTSVSRKGVEINDLAARASTDIRFIPKRGGPLALGYDATILEEICQVIIDADKAGKLAPNQKHLAEKARILQRGFAKVGVIALVDEATGFQKDRPAHALAEILDAFIAKELRDWVRRFPFEFYQEIYRLKGWDTSELKPNSSKPAEVARITVELIYRRLGPSAIYKTLTKLTPRSEKGYLKNKLHLWLSPDIGDPKLGALIDKVIAVMKLSDNWPHLMQNMERAGIRKYTDNLELPFTETRFALPVSTSSPPASSAEVSRAS
jgi:hypothetical protein